MSSDSLPLNLNDVQREFPGWQIDPHEQLSSTNRHAVERAGQFRTPTLVITEKQTAGRGRGRNFWISGEGALTFSLLIEPVQYSIPANEIQLLSLMTAAVVRQAIINVTEIQASSLQLKWPNDLYLQGRKVCGILLEQPAEKRFLLVVGIGLNVNNSKAGMIAELQHTAISLSDILGAELDSIQLLIEIMRCFESALQSVENRTQLFPQMWQRCHLLDDTLVTLDRGESGKPEDLIIGRCEGIDEDGALLLRDQYTTHRIYSGVIRDWS
ncbi:biotin--[acetyl-CoA-carboxylase] ligase [uncultured Rubinisphaera sp.]|uniref:biotin--[acetyl-CoA-carboxylase] ligase n=1 Tax=uncultured Rubinisphaera sp. TaxID=1678686 RepID=UPI0030D9B8E7